MNSVIQQVESKNEIEISILIPFFNSKASLPDCLLSVVRQDFDKKFEVILVDNNSTDNYSVSDILNAHKNVKLVKEEKPGVVFARNRAILEASGKLLFFMSASSTLSKNHLSKIVKAFADKELYMACGAVSSIFSSNLRPSAEIDPYEINFNGNNMVFRSTVFKDFELFDTAKNRENQNKETIAEFSLVKKMLQKNLKCSYFQELKINTNNITNLQNSSKLSLQFKRGLTYSDCIGFGEAISEWKENLYNKIIRLAVLLGKIVQWSGIKGNISKNTPKKYFLNDLGERRADFVSVAICTYNRDDILGDCIEALTRLNCPKSKFEVIIVDNNSTDSTKMVFEEYSTKMTNIRYIFEGEQGLSHARNTAIKESYGNIVCFIDDDALVHQDFISEILITFKKHPQLFSLCGKVRLKEMIPFPKWITGKFRKAFAEFQNGPNEEFISQGGVGANMSFTKDCFEKHGAFNPHLGRKKGNLMSMEDRDFLNMIQQDENSCIYSPNVSVDHCVGDNRITRWFFIKRFYWQSISREAVKLFHDRRKKKWLSLLTDSFIIFFECLYLTFCMVALCFGIGMGKIKNYLT